MKGRKTAKKIISMRRNILFVVKAKLSTHVYVPKPLYLVFGTTTFYVPVASNSIGRRGEA